MTDGGSVRRSWVDGSKERMETFPEELFEMVKARVVGGDEREMVRVLGGGAGGVRVMETTE